MRHVVLNEPIETLVEREALVQDAVLLLELLDVDRRISKRRHLGSASGISGRSGGVTAAGRGFGQESIRDPDAGADYCQACPPVTSGHASQR